MIASAAPPLAWILEGLERDVVHWITCTTHSEALGALFLAAQAKLVPVLLVLGALGWIARTHRARAVRALFAALLGWAAGEGVAEVLWHTIERPRPQAAYERILREPEELAACASMPDALALRSGGSTSPSFPSRHAVAVGVFATALWLARRGAGWLAAAYGLLVCVGRVYSGKHWPSDLLAGVLIGAVLAWFFWRAAPGAARFLLRKRRAAAPPA